ncbi:hypothetical protein PM082_007326 [Marasmius tenuissimus]|nr:hypothetical protein PM082_007326 [Marasmius tenuissimus]
MRHRTAPEPYGGLYFAAHFFWCQSGFSVSQTEKSAQPNFSLLKKLNTNFNGGDGVNTAPNDPFTNDHLISSGGGNGAEASAEELSHTDIQNSDAETQAESGTKRGTFTANSSRQGKQPQMPISKQGDLPERGSHGENIRNTHKTVQAQTRDDMEPPQTLYDIYNELSQSQINVEIGIEQEDATQELLRDLNMIVQDNIGGHMTPDDLDNPSEDIASTDPDQSPNKGEDYDELFGLNITDDDFPDNDDSQPMSSDSGSQTRSHRVKKAAIKIGALNIGGLRTTVDFNDPPRSKWYHLNQVIRDSKFAVVVIGEAHLNADRHNCLEKIFG